MAACSVPDPPVNWDDVVRWFKEEVHGKSLKSCRSLQAICLGAAVYHLSRQRNDLLHGNTPCSKEAIVSQIKRQIRARMLAKGSVKLVGDNLGLACSSLEFTDTDSGVISVGVCCSLLQLASVFVLVGCYLRIA